MNFKPPHKVRKRTLAAAVSVADYTKFEAIARAHGVTVSTYLRSIVVDVLAEDFSKVCVRETKHEAA